MFAKLTKLFAAPAVRPAARPKLGMDALEVRDCPAYFSFSRYMLNPQPLPPGGAVMLNPQPLPPGGGSLLAARGIIIVGG